MQGLILLNSNIYNSTKYLKEIDMLPHPNIQLADIGLGCFSLLGHCLLVAFSKTCSHRQKYSETLKGQFPLKLKFIRLFRLLNYFILWTTKEDV